MPFQLTIVTPQGAVYEGAVDNVVLPGSEGEFGVLQNHERLLAPLRPGEALIQTAQGKLYAAIADGFAEVNGEAVVVMVDSCECSGDVDVARAELARDRAEQHLAALGADAEVERRREYEAALDRARNRLKVAQRTQK